MSQMRLKPESFLDEEKLNALKIIAPDAFADGKINWSTLKAILGGELEDAEKPDEHFGLFRSGHAAEPPAVLKKKTGKSQSYRQI